MSLIRSFNTRRQVIGVLCAAMLIFPSAGALAQGTGQPAGNGLLIPITGTIGGVAAFVGNFQLQRFAVVDGALSAVGVLTGSLTTGGVTTSIVRSLTIPILPGGITATCDILHLELGPLNLDLLGVIVNLNRVVLDIDAQAGPGNLLGNLLCAVAGLLDNPAAALGGVAQLLNRILAILG